MLRREPSGRDPRMVGPGHADRDLHRMLGGANSSSAPAPAPPELGQPGASLLREHERRRRNREHRTREAHPHIGGLLLALNDAPQHESAFEQGALAERAVADSLATRTDSDRVITLHNRRMPGSFGDIDHVAVAPTGVWVIDTKDWQGRVGINRPLFGTRRLLIRGRECTRLIDGLERQIAAVRAALDRGGDHQIPLQGALCFTKADLPFLRTQTFRGHLLLYRKALAERAQRRWPALAGHDRARRAEARNKASPGAVIRPPSVADTARRGTPPPSSSAQHHERARRCRDMAAAGGLHGQRRDRAPLHGKGEAGRHGGRRASAAPGSVSGWSERRCRMSRGSSR